MFIETCQACRHQQNLNRHDSTILLAVLQLSSSQVYLFSDARELFNVTPPTGFSWINLVALAPISWLCGLSLILSPIWPSLRMDITFSSLGAWPKKGSQFRLVKGVFYCFESFDLKPTHTWRVLAACQKSNFLTGYYLLVCNLPLIAKNKVRD